MFLATLMEMVQALATLFAVMVQSLAVFAPTPSYWYLYSTTLFDCESKVTPTGIKMIPIRRNVAITQVGVKMGCHAFKRCCLNGVSARKGRVSKNDFEENQ